MLAVAIACLIAAIAAICYGQWIDYRYRNEISVVPSIPPELRELYMRAIADVSGEKELGVLQFVDEPILTGMSGSLCCIRFATLCNPNDESNRNKLQLALSGVVNRVLVAAQPDYLHPQRPRPTTATFFSWIPADSGVYWLEIRFARTFKERMAVAYLLNALQEIGKVSKDTPPCSISLDL